MSHDLMQVNIRDSNPPRTLCTEPYICLHLLRILYPILFNFQPLLAARIEKNDREHDVFVRCFGTSYT
ncbi:hypothetical protein EMIT0111MI5_40130 [Burkholderia sp. IT-111MI5]